MDERLQLNNLFPDKCILSGQVVYETSDGNVLQSVSYYDAATGLLLKTRVTTDAGKGAGVQPCSFAAKYFCLLKFRL